MDASTFHADSKIISKKKLFLTFLLVTVNDYFPILFVTVSLTSALDIAKQTADFVTYHWAVQMGRKDSEFVGLNFTFNGFHFFFDIRGSVHHNTVLIK